MASGSLRVQVFLKNHTYLSLIGGLVPLKVRVRWLGSGKNCLGLRKNYYGLARVLQKIGRVGLGKTPSGRGLTWPIPNSYRCLTCSMNYFFDIIIFIWHQFTLWNTNLFIKEIVIPKISYYLSSYENRLINKYNTSWKYWFRNNIS